MTVDSDAPDPGDVTLATYDRGAATYVAASAPPNTGSHDFIDRLADLVPGGHVLEIGSGPGWDADHLESRGLRVTRTDGSAAFVAMQRAAGHEVRLLDVRTAPLGGPYDAILANAVLLHLSREQFADVLGRARRAVDDGVLAFSLKEGDGAAWSEAKIGLPRHFTYWRAEQVREVLQRTGWTVHSLDHRAGRTEQWLLVIARPTRDR